MSGGYIESRRGVDGPYSKSIDDLFVEWDRESSPGAVLAVCQAGKLIHQRGYGVANIEDDIPFSINTVMRLGSTSKHLCATCILVLENRGLLSLDDDVRHWVPELPDFGATITLRHLLTMTSGLADGINLLLFAGLDTSHALSREQALKLYCAPAGLLFQPGDDWTYSNTNYSLLTLVIERISGGSLADFMTRELFEPLGMRDSRLTPWMTDCVPRKARGYEKAACGRYRASLMAMELDGNGGVDSTIDDMLKWYANFRDDSVFGPNYRARLEAENRLNDGQLLDYRLGIEVRDYRGLQVVRHAGGMPGYLCDFVHYPQPDLGIVMFTNLLEPRMLELPDRMADIVLERDFPAPRSRMYIAAAKPHDTVLCGVYADATEGLVVELAEQDGALVCYWLGELHLLRNHGGWIQSWKSPLALRALADGLEMRTGCQPPRRLRRVPDPRETAGRPVGGLASYAGRFYQHELEETHSVQFENDGLTVTLASLTRVLVWKRLRWLEGDLFVALVDGEPSCTNVTVRFLRDGTGKVDAMSYSISRCRDVVFRRIPASGQAA